MGKTLFVVDDEPAIRKAIKQSLSQISCEVRCFSSAETCLKSINAGECDVLITDINMPNMDGVQLIEAVRKDRPLLPIIAITGYGDVPMAVSAMKAGAADFIQKPLQESTLLPAVRKALRIDGGDQETPATNLTKAERRVLHYVATGKTNREIAEILNRSPRTVENHRLRLSKKLGAQNSADLIRIAISLGLGKSPD